MVMDVIISASLSPASELLSKIVVTIYDTVRAAKEVLIQKENFRKFSAYLENIGLMLNELSQQNVDCSEGLRNAIEILDREATLSKQLVTDCSKRNKVYLLVRSRQIVESIEGCTREIARALSLLPLASLDVSLGIQEKMEGLCKKMLEVEYSAELAEEEILSKIELGIRERRVDRAYANDLVARISEAVGINHENSLIRKEFEEFKREIEEVEVMKNRAEQLQMEQIIALLEKADVVTSHAEKEKKYLETRNIVGGQPLEPLRSFYCPISLDVMVDPVETSSGMTFERQEIEKWFAMGNKTCPLTQIPIEDTVLRPNKNLRQSIEEWKDRNTMIMIASIKPKLGSDDEKEVIQCLEQLEELCLEKELHREWVGLENYEPVLVGILRSKNAMIRRHALTMLTILARDSNENKEKIYAVENVLEQIVRSLSRQTREGKLAVQLLLELSKYPAARENMGDVRGCIFSLVTVSKKEDNEASEDAQSLLEILTSRYQNVVQMANANYFKPLLRLLTSGPEDAQMAMAKTLSEIELTERQKISLFELGAFGPLLGLLSSDNPEMKQVSVKCLRCLSSIPQNGRQMIKEGVVGHLLELLYRHSLSSPTLREHVAATLMHLSQSTVLEEGGGEPDQSDGIQLLESEDDILKLFSLISLTGPNIQGNILRAFYAMCQSPFGSNIRTKLRQLSAVQLLVPLCEAPNLAVRANAVKLFYCLTEDNDDISISEHVGQKCLESLLKIAESSADADEVASAMGIISNLPKDPEITKWLLEAEVLSVIVSFLSDENRNDPNKRRCVENSLGALHRFTDPANPECQKKVADVGIISVLVKFLGTGTRLMKMYSAVSLKQLSKSSSLLSRPVKGAGISVMLGTTVLIASTLVPRMGGDYGDKARVIQSLLFMSGINTLIQTFLGTRLPTLMGASFAFYLPVLSIINDNLDKNFTDEHHRFVYTIRTIQGSLIISSFVNIILGFSRAWGNFMRLFTPVTISPVVCVVGLGLFLRGFPLLANCVELGLPMLILLILSQQYLKRIVPGAHHVLERYALLICIGIIWVFAVILTVSGAYNNVPEQTKLSCRTDRSHLLSSAPWIKIPYPFQWGTPIFSASHVFGMMGAALVSSAESTAAFYAASRLAGATPPPAHVLSRSIGLHGIGMLIEGIFGTVVGTTASVENVGLLGLTRIGSRRVIQISTVFMIFFSIFGKFGAFFASIPLPIFGAIYCIVLGIVAAVGISFVQFANNNSMRNHYVLGVTLFLGISVSEYFVLNTNGNGRGPVRTGGSWFNDILNAIFSSAPLVAMIVGPFLDNTLDAKHTRDERGIPWWAPFQDRKGDVRNDEFYSYPLRIHELVPSRFL